MNNLVWISGSAIVDMSLLRYVNFSVVDGELHAQAVSSVDGSQNAQTTDTTGIHAAALYLYLSSERPIMVNLDPAIAAAVKQIVDKHNAEMKRGK